MIRQPVRQLLIGPAAGVRRRGLSTCWTCASTTLSENPASSVGDNISTEDLSVRRMMSTKCDDNTLKYDRLISALHDYDKCSSNNPQWLVILQHHTNRRTPRTSSPKWFYLGITTKTINYNVQLSMWAAEKMWSRDYTKKYKPWLRRQLMCMKLLYILAVNISPNFETKSVEDQLTHGKAKRRICVWSTELWMVATKASDSITCTSCSECAH